MRIYFDTTTFEKVTKDSAAKFEDMLSAIGGTMGLLTGFSIISAVEVVYFSLKVFFRLFMRWMHLNDVKKPILGRKNYWCFITLWINILHVCNKMIFNIFFIKYSICFWLIHARIIRGRWELNKSNPGICLLIYSWPDNKL